MPVRIVLADDHRIVREGLAALLRREPDLEIVGEAADGFDAVRLARELQPDIVISDISMPGLNGIEAIRRILEHVPGVRTLCLSVHDETRLVGSVMDAGASGYLLKECAYEELLRAVRALLANRVYISPSIAGVLMKDYRERRAGGAARVGSELTAREREVVQLIAEGLSTKQIADRLHLSVKTVGTHREHILAKLKLTGTAELTRYAIREGLAGLDVRGSARPRRDPAA